MAGYNQTRYVEELLERNVSQPPSFAVHLHAEHWTLNNGSKFLYNNNIASLLDDIRAHRIPVDFLELFDQAGVPFYDGCMIVDLLDYRPQKKNEASLETPDKTRTVLHPNPETLWADICLMNQKRGGNWTDQDALEIEAGILLATAPSLCLDPDPHLTRMANHILRVSTPTIPVSLKRKAAALDPEEDEIEKARRTKIMMSMSPRSNRVHAPNYHILDAIQRHKVAKETKPATPAPPQNPPVHQFPPTNHPSPAQRQPTPAQFIQAHSPANSEDQSRKKLKPKKLDTPQMAFSRINGSQTPVPQAPQQFHPVTQPVPSHSPSPVSQSPRQPPTYVHVQPAPGRVPTPAQRRYTPTPVQSQPPPPAAQAPPHPQPTSTPVQQFQPQIPSARFLQQPPVARNPQAMINAGQTASHPSPPKTQNPTAPQPQMMYAPQMQQLHHPSVMLQQRIAQAQVQQSGRSTPQAPPTQSAAGPVRGSPMISTQRLGTRSPMPPNTPQMTQVPHPTQQHPNQMSFAQPFNPVHLRPGVQGMPSPHPQHQPNQPNHPAGANAPPRTQGSPSPTATVDGKQQPPQPQAQPPQMQHPQHAYQMYAYPAQMNYAMRGAMPPGAYWVGGLPRPVPGQAVHGLPPNAQHPQQMPPKPGPGGAPGR